MKSAATTAERAAATAERAAATAERAAATAERKRISQDPLNKLKVYREIAAELREMTKEGVPDDDPFMTSLKKARVDAYVAYGEAAAREEETHGEEDTS